MTPWHDPSNERLITRPAVPAAAAGPTRRTSMIRRLIAESCYSAVLEVDVPDGTRLEPAEPTAT